MGTTNMNLTQSSVGVTTGPDWATNTEGNWTAIDTHDHSSGKGVQISPAGININADLEFNANDATELRTVAFDSSASATSSADRRCFYEDGGDIYWRNASGTAVQITSGTAVGSGVGSIDGMGGTQAQVQYNDTAGQKSFSFIHDKTASPKSVAKMAFSDTSLYNFSNSNYFVQLNYTGTGSSGILTVPDETGTLLSSASSVSDISVTSTTASKPILTLANNANDATSSTINLKNLRGGSNAGVAGDDAGTINFYANDAANNNQIYSSILAEIGDPTSGGEEGKISISVAEYDGTVTPGFILTGTAADGIIDATIGAGATSTTTIAGNLDINDGTIINVGDIDCDSISCADAANGLDINFNANTGTNKISLTDNLASALDITEAGNSYIKFVTSDSSEQIVIGKNSTFSGTTIADLGTITTADINGGTWQGTIDGSWTASGQTCADLGTVTTADINGGTVDGADVTVGSGKTFNVSAGTFTSSTAQKQAIVDGATIEAQDLASGSGTSLPNNVQDAIVRTGTVASGTWGASFNSTAWLSQIKGTSYGLTGNVFGSQNPLGNSSNWELADSATSGVYAPSNFMSINNLITESSGVFSFTETGYFLILFSCHNISNSGDTSYYQAELQAKPDASTAYQPQATASSTCGATGNQCYVGFHKLLKITDTTNQKIQIVVATTNSDHYAQGGSGCARTFITATKLGGL